MVTNTITVLWLLVSSEVFCCSRVLLVVVWDCKSFDQLTAMVSSSVNVTYTCIL